MSNNGTVPTTSFDSNYDYEVQIAGQPPTLLPLYSFYAFIGELFLLTTALVVAAIVHTMLEALDAIHNALGQLYVFPCLARSPIYDRILMCYVVVGTKRYTNAHEWIELSPDGKTGTIGISKYAANALGDVVYVELPTTDQEVAAGDAIGAVESVKSASDIYAPIGGKITKANELLEEKPGTINTGPEDGGWIAKLEVKDTGEVEKLMDVEAYRKFTEEDTGEEEEFKDAEAYRKFREE